MVCLICKRQGCDDDCMELAANYRASRRDGLLDLADELPECPVHDRCDCLGACKLDHSRSQA